MTDQQLEAAARALCKLRGQDPDEEVETSDVVERRADRMLIALRYAPRWHAALVEVAEAWRLRQAIMEGLRVTGG